MHSLIHGAGGSAAAADPPLPEWGTAHAPPPPSPQGSGLHGRPHSALPSAAADQPSCRLPAPAPAPRSGRPSVFGSSPLSANGDGRFPARRPISFPPCRISANVPALPASWLRARRGARVMLGHSTNLPWFPLRCLSSEPFPGHGCRLSLADTKDSSVLWVQLTLCVEVVTVLCGTNCA